MRNEPKSDDALAALAAEIGELRTSIKQLRDAALLAPENSVPRAEAAKSWNSPVSRATQSVEANLTAVRAALRLVEREIIKLQTQLDVAENDTSHQRAKRAEVTARLNARERLLADIQSSVAWKIAKPLWKLIESSREKPELSSAARSDDFEFEIEAPSVWKLSSEILVIKGWCRSRTGRDIAGVRAKIGQRGRLGRYGIERPEFRSGPGGVSAARIGFAIEVPVPAGSSKVRVEAIVLGGAWEPFFGQTVEREAQADDQENEAAADVRVARRALPNLPAVNARKAFDLLAPLFREHGYGATLSPLFSIITPAYNSKPQWLAEAALTLLNQSIRDWEWCIVDDGSSAKETKRLLEQLAGVSPRLQIRFIENSGISAATNTALDFASGEFVCFLDHDDLLDPEALELMEEQVNRGFDVVYSDEDKLDDVSRRLVEPFHKPDWSPEYFRGVMYVGHLLCVRRDLARAVRFDSAYDGVQDFEFMLRASETDAKIAHIPQVLYHWRKSPGSIAASTDAKPEAAAAQERAVNAHLQRLGLPARAEMKTPHRLRMVPHAREHYPRISIIVPTKDAPELLGRCLDSLYTRTSYADFEVIAVDNGTTDPEAIAVMQRHPIHRVDFPGKFNFSRANNLGAQHATGEFLVFLNNDTEVDSADWLQHLLYHAEQPDVGAAGALLLYPDSTVQHAGVALGMRGTADHTMRGFPPDVDGYAGSLACAREVSAVTAACMMIRKSLFTQIGGFNEHFFTAYQDLDLCLRLRDRGLRIIYTPGAVVVHHESASRKKYYDMVDRMLLLDQWEPLIERGDPYYNRNLNLERGDYSLV